MKKKKAPSRPRRGAYEVGKGRPPKATRWKPGQSGNPRGRPRGAKNIATLIDEALQQKVQIEERGKLRTITARELIARKQVSLAAKGDPKATAFVFAIEPQGARQRQPPEKLPVHDHVEMSKIYSRIMKVTEG
jgi:hypothetical protein